MLLLPSYLSMDRNYREAVAHVEQADQLVNNATSAADIEFGAKKVALAQRNLDKLPVWFLGYEPRSMCRFMGGCSWRFTFDEFRQARARVGRMDARIFQEKNALTALQSAETTIQSAKSRYEQAGDAGTKQVTIADWRRAINELSLIPPKTFAGEQARNKLKIIQQDFQSVAGWAAGSAQTQTMIVAAQKFANRADQVIATAPLTPDQWKETQTMYTEAINRLQEVKSQDPQYLKAQAFLADYTQKSAQIITRLAAEQSAVQVFDGAQGQIKALLTNMPDSGDTLGRNRLRGEIIQIISQLEKVEEGTTVHGKAQTLIQQARDAVRKL